LKLQRQKTPHKHEHTSTTRHAMHTPSYGVTHHLGVHMLSSEHQVRVEHDLIPVLPPVLWLGHSCDRNRSLAADENEGASTLTELAEMYERDNLL
jgi:hypothetical protein